MPLNAPTLILTVPNTNFWGDSCTMSVSSSQPLKPSWVYTWTFGDSTSLTSQQDTVQHYFLNPGNITVRVALNDTLHHIPLGSKTATVQVTARHFNLGLLQSMKYVDVIWHAFVDTTKTGFGGICSGPIPTIATMPVSWIGANFGTSRGGGYGKWDSTHYYLLDSLSYESSDTGNLDLGLTCLINFSEDSSHYGFYESSNPGSNFCRITEGYSFYTHATPFKSSSDSDVVFEAAGSLCNNSGFNASVNSNSLEGPFSYQANSNFSINAANRYIIIRFHK